MMYKEFYDKDSTDTRSEDAHQIDAIAWLRYQFPTWITFHVNNYKEFYDKDSTDTRSEDAHQIDAIAWLRYQFPTWITFHVNNEGKKSPGQANKDQMKGLLKGVPDILIIPDRTQCKYGFIAIELKRAKKSL
ncbi:putative endonuclease [Citrobacter phage HCF1]|uniref:Endonuclease n=1 Tax=Citrobacter phage HCF1 TaxID=2849700 RepID=A0ABX6D4A7_9CAUD|nr:putative endonuclease [Citrobacter phage HCF1]